MAVFSYTAPKPDKYKGVFLTEEALQTAHPTATVGDEADVDPGEGQKAVRYHYDAQEGWVPGGGGDTAWEFAFEDETKQVYSNMALDSSPSGAYPSLYAYFANKASGSSVETGFSTAAEPEAGTNRNFISALKNGELVGDVTLESITDPNDPEVTKYRITVAKQIGGVKTQTVFEIRPDGLYLNGSPFTGGDGGTTTIDWTAIPGYNATVMQTLMHPANGVIQWGNGGTSTPLPTPTAPGGMVITSNPDGTKNIDFTLATI